jgi:hypothetical protein
MNAVEAKRSYLVPGFSHRSFHPKNPGTTAIEGIIRAERTAISPEPARIALEQLHHHGKGRAA